MDMKIAVISDIHGNRWALEAVLEDIKRQNASHIVNLGDSLYGPLDPSGTAEILINTGIISIAGNQDRNIIESVSKPSLHHTMKYVLGSLKAVHLDWLKALKPSYILADDFFLCHGTPSKDDEYLIERVTQYGVSPKPLNILVEELYIIKQRFILCGHSHLSSIISLPDEKIIINPGSIGLPAYDDDMPYYHKMESGNPRAKYCFIIYKDGNLKVEKIDVEYNFNEAAKCALQNNRSDWANWIRTGIC